MTPMNTCISEFEWKL